VLVSPEATAALLGAAGGWILGFFTDLARSEMLARRARRVAALLVFAELTTNIAAVSALRKFGVWSTARIHRSAWEANGAALLHRASLDRTGHLAQAYSSLEDVGFIAGESGRDFTSGDDADFLDEVLMPLIFDGLREVGSLAGVEKAEVESRIATSKRAMQGPPPPRRG